MRDVTVASLKNPTVIVAEEVNWTVKPGEFWVVGSPQYSGKTDFLMTVGGIVVTDRWGVSFSRGSRCRFLKSRAWRID